MVARHAALLTASPGLGHPVGPLKIQVRLTEKQKEVLERIYASNQYPNSSIIRKLCEELNLEWDTVNWWFRSKRAHGKPFLLEYIYSGILAYTISAF